MEKETEVRHWDDLVFEKRNKDYGAYDLRTTYSKNMVTGEIATLIFAALLFATPQIMKMFGVENTMLPTVVSKDPGIHITPPPLFKKDVDVTKPKTPKTNTRLVPLVTTENVEHDSTALNTPDEPAPVGDENGQGGGTVTTGETGPPPEPLPPVDDNRVHDMSQISPAYIGGMQAMMKFMQSNLHYPASDRRIGNEGTVYVSFVINRAGQVTDVKVLRGISSTCDKEAMRVVSAMNNSWTPGRNGDTPVNVRMVLPIKFIIQ